MENIKLRKDLTQSDFDKMQQCAVVIEKKYSKKSNRYYMVGNLDLGKSEKTGLRSLKEFQIDQKKYEIVYLTKGLHPVQGKDGTEFIKVKVPVRFSTASDEKTGRDYHLMEIFLTPKDCLSVFMKNDDMRHLEVNGINIEWLPRVFDEELLKMVETPEFDD